MKPKTSWIVCVGCNHDACGAIKSEVGGCSTGKSFRFVRACVRAVWLPSGIGSQKLWAGLFPFPFGPAVVLGLFLFGPGWARGAFPFPFWSRELSLFPSPTPQTSYPTSVGLIGYKHICLSEVGGCSTGKSFRFVRACVRAVWL